MAIEAQIMMQSHRKKKKVDSVLTVGCENDDCFSWFHFINSYFIYGCFEDKMRLSNYTKGKAGRSTTYKLPDQRVRLLGILRSWKGDISK